MNDDDTFRLALVLVGLIFMPLGLYHRIRSHTGEKLDRWQEGALLPFVLGRLRLLAELPELWRHRRLLRSLGPDDATTWQLERRWWG